MGGIFAEGEETILLRSGYGGFSAVNHDNVHVFSVNRGGGFTAHSAETTEYEMRFNRIDLLFHSSPPHEYSEYLVLYHGLHGHGEYVEHQPDTTQHDEEVENATDRRKGPHFFIPYRRHGEHRHIDGVEKTPAFDNHKARGSHQKDDSKRQPAAREPAGGDGYEQIV